jgi:hypothetical protein
LFLLVPAGGFVSLLSPGLDSVTAKDVGVDPVFALGDVLLDERDAPAGEVEGVRKLAQSLIGEASNLRNLFRTKAITLHKPARGVSAQLP